MANIKNFGLVGIGGDVQFGKNGSRLIMSGADFHFRNAQDSDFANIKAKNLVVAGDLTVQGTKTELQTETLIVEDKNIELGVVTGGTADDTTAQGGGITLKGTTDKEIKWDSALGGEWVSTESFDLAAGKKYRIGGVDILTNTTLGSSVTNSALTSVGTLVGLTVAGNTTIGGTLTAFGAADAGKTVKIGSAGEMIVAAGNVFDNITISGNTISSTNTDGPIVLDPNGAGVVVMSGAKVTQMADGTLATDGATVGQMTTAIGVETTRATAAEATLTTAIATEKTRAEAAEATLQAAISAEVARATAAETQLVATTMQLVTTEQNRAILREDAIEDALEAEVARATAAEATLTTAIATEKTRAETAEATLTTAIATEKTRAEAAEAALDTRLDALEAAKTRLNTVGLGLSYDQASETLTLASTADATASTLVARDATGAAKFANLYDTGLTAQKIVFADATGLIKSAADISVSTTGDALTVGSITLSANKLTVVGGALSVEGATITNVGAPVNSTDAVNKNYVDTAIAAVTIPNLAHAVYKAFGTAAETVVGTVTGFVHRVKVYVGSAYSAGASIQVGITGAQGDLVTNADLDPEQAGIYTVEIGKMYATATELKVFVSGAAAGAGAVIVEYL